MVERRTKFTQAPCFFAVVMGCSFLLGCILACAFAEGVANSQARELDSYLTDYLSLARNDLLPNFFAEALCHHALWGLLYILAGVSVFRSILLPVLFGTRGFLMVFTTGCFLRFLGERGIIPAILISGLSASAWLPGMLLFSFGVLKAVSLRTAVKSGDRLLRGQTEVESRTYFLVAGLLFCFCVCLEVFLIPALLPAVSRIIEFR